MANLVHPNDLEDVERSLHLNSKTEHRSRQSVKEVEGGELHTAAESIATHISSRSDAASPSIAPEAEAALEAEPQPAPLQPKVPRSKTVTIEAPIIPARV